jgi:hypothetical protein
MEGVAPGGGESAGAAVAPKALPPTGKLYDVQGRRVDPAMGRSGVTFGQRKRVRVK